MFTQHTKKQRMYFLFISLLISILCMFWYMIQTSAVSLLALILAIISTISQFVLIRRKMYKVAE